MDVNALGTQFMNTPFVPFSSQDNGVSGSRSRGSGGFEEILKRAQSSGASPESAPRALNKTQIDKTDKLFELCQELETFLIKNLIKSMRSTVQKTKLIDTGFAGEVYEDMLYDEYAKALSKNANFGFAEMAYRDLTRRTS